MEKAVIFAPLIIFFVIFALLIFGFFAFIIKIIKKSKNEDWSGIVVDKKHNQYNDMDDDKPHDNYYLVVKLDTGKQRNIGLSGALWDNFKVGDRLKKPKGKLLPEKQ
jgi:hypothetical protein